LLYFGAKSKGNRLEAAYFIRWLLCVVLNINTTNGAIIYIRTVNIYRDGEQYGSYYQAVRFYRGERQGEARRYPSGRAHHRLTRR
jgi:hypothetical protein